MSIELKEAAQQALSALENSQPHPSNPVIGLTKQDFIDHEETIRQLLAAIQQAEAQQPATGEPVGQVFYAAYGGDDETGAGYYMQPCVHWFGKAPAADTKLYTHPAPSVRDAAQEAVEELHKLNEYAIVYIDDPEWTRVSDTCQKLIGSIGAAMLHNH